MGKINNICVTPAGEKKKKNLNENVDFVCGICSY